jgi:hypothetical protein
MRKIKESFYDLRATKIEDLYKDLQEWFDISDKVINKLDMLYRDTNNKKIQDRLKHFLKEIPNLAALTGYIVILDRVFKEEE